LYFVARAWVDAVEAVKSWNRDAYGASHAVLGKPYAEVLLGWNASGLRAREMETGAGGQPDEVREYENLRKKGLERT
jgi:hypothetical protein